MQLSITLKASTCTTMKSRNHMSDFNGVEWSTRLNFTSVSFLRVETLLSFSVDVLLLKRMDSKYVCSLN